MKMGALPTTPNGSTPNVTGTAPNVVGTTPNLTGITS
eukprot:CAMPEP_0203903132 /NCGR_PEP_ID=MMETSP0359-20131031/45119_1 /ASSEMBLY_ACC=CAM_ASM_000338 /TAXON_ID=268821 /ORGANISM="Scrippsiella Hangoei, Strain SHTV-5" /LENGTH=36 /DNA_ID= /DNA_START= /DNA_END= /DNA_ORIENTATION=